jgi:hypothetical protein
LGKRFGDGTTMDWPGRVIEVQHRREQISQQKDSLLEKLRQIGSLHESAGPHRR